MISLDHPWLKAALLDRAPAPMLVDWLQDQACTRADMALLFAGTPPAFLDGIPQEVLALWLECQGEEDQAETIGCWSVFYDPHTRWTGDRYLGCWYVCDEDSVSGWSTQGAAHRDLKRRILALPWAKDVQVERALGFGVRLPEDDLSSPILEIEDRMRQGGVRLDLPHTTTRTYGFPPDDVWIRVRQTLAAADLIPPETRDPRRTAAPRHTFR